MLNSKMRVFMLAGVSLGLVLSFQNCSKSAFKKEEVTVGSSTIDTDDEKSDEVDVPVDGTATYTDPTEVDINVNGSVPGRECEIKLAIDPSELSFRLDRVGTSQVKSFDLINAGADDIVDPEIVSFKPIGAASTGKFTVQKFHCEGRKLAPGDRCAVEVKFTSNEVGEFKGRMVLAGICSFRN